MNKNPPRNQVHPERRETNNSSIGGSFEGKRSRKTYSSIEDVSDDEVAVSPSSNAFLEVELTQLPKGILLPYKGFRPKWDLVVVCLVLWICFRVPTQIAFTDGTVGFFFIFDYVCDALFIADIIIQFRTAVFIDGNLMVRPHGIATHYVKRAFSIDLLASLPLDVAIIFMFGSSYKYLPFFRIGRLLRFNRAYRWVGSFENNLRINAALIRVAKLLFLILVLTHWVGCFWYVMEEFEGFQGFRNNWREDQIATFAERSQLARQLKSWYWALATLTAVGNEDYYPKTNVEVVFQIFCTLLGASIYAGFIGNLASLMSDGNSASAVFRTKMEHVKHYLGYRQIADDLKDRVFSYYEYLWSRHNGMDENVILNDLPQQLKVEVALNVAKKSVRTVFTKSFFKKVQSSFVKRVVSALTTKVLAPGEYIIKAGQVGNAMYFVNAGYVEVLNEKPGQPPEILSVLRAGQYFGERALLTAELRAVSVRAASYTDLFVLTRGTLNKILYDYPEYRIAVRGNARMLELTEEKRVQVIREKLGFFVSLRKLEASVPIEDRTKIATQKILTWIWNLRRRNLGFFHRQAQKSAMGHVVEPDVLTRHRSGSMSNKGVLFVEDPAKEANSPTEMPTERVTVDTTSQVLIGKLPQEVVEANDQ